MFNILRKTQRKNVFLILVVTKYLVSRVFLSYYLF